MPTSNPFNASPSFMNSAQTIAMHRSPSLALKTREALPLTAEQVKSFRRDGFVIVRDFYDARVEVEPIQRAIHSILALLLRKYQVPVIQDDFAPECFDSGYQALLALERRIGGEVYDAVKQIPAFVRLVASAKNEAAVRQLRETDSAGIAAAGYGIRIDNPGEELYKAPWHQEYPAQFRSIDGIVFWSPLLEVTRDLGPVEVLRGSHREGLIRVHTRDPRNPEKSGAYALILENEEQHVDRYESAAPLMRPGDVLIMDFLTIHRSGTNRTKRSRWSMQIRYFNFEHPSGISIGWSGSFKAGADIKKVHPDLFID